MNKILAHVIKSFSFHFFLIKKHPSISGIRVITKSLHLFSFRSRCCWENKKEHSKQESNDNLRKFLCKRSELLSRGRPIYRSADICHFFIYRHRPISMFSSADLKSGTFAVSPVLLMQWTCFTQK